MLIKTTNSDYWNSIRAKIPNNEFIPEFKFTFFRVKFSSILIKLDQFSQPIKVIQFSIIPCVQFVQIKIFHLSSIQNRLIKWFPKVSDSCCMQKKIKSTLWNKGNYVFKKYWYEMQLSCNDCLNLKKYVCSLRTRQINET